MNDSERTRVKKNIALFLGLLTLICIPVNYMIVHTHDIGAGMGPVSYALLIMWCPALAALITCRARRIPLDDLGWRWRPFKYQALAYVVPIAYFTIGYGAVWLTGNGRFYNREFVAQVAKSFGWSLPNGAIIVLYVLIMGTFGMIRAMGFALGEEIGWRGLLTPQFSKLGFSYTATSLWVGLIWTLYHFPALLFSNFNPDGPTWYSLISFSVGCFSICFIITWLRLKSGNLWTAVVLHASNNMFIAQIFTRLTVDTGKTNRYFADPDFVVTVVMVLVAFLFWRKRHEVEPQLRPAPATAMSGAMETG